MVDASFVVKNEFVKLNVDKEVSITPSVSYITPLTQQYREAAGKAIEVSTASSMNNMLVEENVGKVYKYVGETDETFTNGQYYIIEEV